MIDRHRYKFWIRATVIIIFVLACAHRLIGLGQVPQPHATNDEFDYMWAGTAIVHGESPIGWSFINPRKINFLGIYVINNIRHPMHSPFLDHPPVFQILAGLTATLAGAQQKSITLLETGRKITLYETPLKKLRLLPLILFIISFWLLWYWIRLIAGPATALLTVTLYSFIEIMAIHQRLVVPDNLMAPLTLATFLTLELWRRHRLPSLTTGLLVSLFVALNIGTKAVGLMLVPAILFWATIALPHKQQKHQTLKWSLIGIALGLAMVIGTGALLDWHAFLATMKAQSRRFLDFNGIFQLIGQPKTVDTPQLNGWILAGWLLLFTNSASDRPPTHKALSAIAIALIACFTFFAPDFTYGWYNCTFFPFLAAAWALALRRAWRHPAHPASAITLLLISIVAFTSALTVIPYGKEYIRYAYPPIAAIALLPWLIPRRLHTLLMHTALTLIPIIGLLSEVASLMKKVQ